MSDVEAHKGKLYPVDLEGSTIDEWIQNFTGVTEYKSYYESWLDYFISEYSDEFVYQPENEKLYRIESEQLNNENFVISNKNSDGSYDYIISFYNGGASFTEVIQEAIRKADTKEIYDLVVNDEQTIAAHKRAETNPELWSPADNLP